jgi:hypothetical protein
MKQNAYRPHPDVRKIGQGKSRGGFRFRLRPLDGPSEQTVNLLQEPK